MNKDILNTFLLASSFLALFGIAEVLYHFLKVKVELTRKLVHVGTGLLSLLFPVLLGNHWPVLFLCGSFGLILILSLRYNLLKSINAIERKSVGSLAYPVSVYFCYLAFDYYNKDFMFFYLPILILAISDPVAALTGKRWPMGKYRIGADQKTLMGSTMFFLSAFLICFIFMSLYSMDNKNLLIDVLICSSFVGIVSAISEAFSGKGYDNITIPISVLSVLVVSPFLFN